MDDTKNKAWIDRIIEELVNAKDAVANNAAELNQFYTLIKLIFNNARLDYSGENLRSENDDAIFEYLKVIDPDTYYRKLNSLKIEREAEIEERKAKAKEAKGKKEA